MSYFDSTGCEFWFNGYQPSKRTQFIFQSSSLDSLTDNGIGMTPSFLPPAIGAGRAEFYSQKERVTYFGKIFSLVSHEMKQTWSLERVSRMLDIHSTVDTFYITYVWHKDKILEQRSYPFLGVFFSIILQETTILLDKYGFSMKYWLIYLCFTDYQLFVSYSTSKHILNCKNLCEWIFS